jgi:Transcriptional regulator PadR-like family
MSRNQPFEDVVQELLLEESRPSHAALVRWCRRYPGHREELEKFFADWAVDAALPEQFTEDDDRMGARTADYALDLLRRQRAASRPAPAPEAAKGRRLSEHDQVVLIAVHLLGGEGTPAAITLRLDEMLEKPPLLGSVFVSLDRLESRGLVYSHQKESGGEPRTCYNVTLAGQRALTEIDIPARKWIEGLEDLT